MVFQVERLIRLIQGSNLALTGRKMFSVTRRLVLGVKVDFSGLLGIFRREFLDCRCCSDVRIVYLPVHKNVGHNGQINSLAKI